MGAGEKQYGVGLRYGQAVCNPFDCSAGECRVPDMCSYPTMTYTTKDTFSVTLPGGSHGSGSLLFTAAPQLAVVNMDPFDSAIINSASMYHYGGGLFQPFHAAATWDQLTAKFAQFRVTAVGLRIKSLIPALSDTGKFIFAKVPSVGQIPPVETLDSILPTFGANISTTGVLANITGLNTGSVYTANHNISSSIVGLPKSLVVTTRELGGHGIEFSLLPVTPAAYDFVNTTITPFGYTAAAGDILAINGNLQNGTYDTTRTAASSSSLHVGFENLLFYWEGVPHTNPDPVFEIEYIYHYEGVPAVSPANNLVPGSAIKSVVAPNELHKAHNLFSDLPVGKIVKTIGGYGQAAMAGYAAGNIPGALGSLFAQMVL